MDVTETSDQNDLRELVERLAQIRLEQNLRQIDVARSLGVGQPVVSEFERGVSRPRVDTVQKYARAVGATVHFSVEAPPLPETDSTDNQNGTEQ